MRATSLRPWHLQESVPRCGLSQRRKRSKREGKTLTVAGMQSGEREQNGELLKGGYKEQHRGRCATQRRWRQRLGVGGSREGWESWGQVDQDDSAGGLHVVVVVLFVVLQGNEESRGEQRGKGEKEKRGHRQSGSRDGASVTEREGRRRRALARGQQRTSPPEAELSSSSS